MFNDISREILLQSQGNMNDYVADVYRKYADLDRNTMTKPADLGEQKLRNSTYQTNQAVDFYRRECDKFTLVSLKRISGCKTEK